MGRLGVPDRYDDAFCGRVPNSVLAKRYSDFAPEELLEIYGKAAIKILSRNGDPESYSNALPICLIILAKSILMTSLSCSSK